MKRILSLLAATLLTTLVGCDQKSATGDAITPVATQTPPQPTAEPEANTIKVNHPQGMTEVHKNPNNVVAFDFGTLDTLDALGVTAIRALPTKNIPAYLSKYTNENMTNAGSMKQPDLEAIKHLNPELIIITGRQGKSYESLSEIAPTLNLSLNNKLYLDSFKKNVLTLGQIFGKTEQAENGLAVLDKKIAESRKKAEASGQSAIVLVHYNGKLSASATNGYASIIHQVLGVKKADVSLGEERQAGTPDYLLEKNPDIIFIVDRNEAIGEGKMDRSLMENEKIKQTNAFRKGKIVYLKPDLWYLSGGGLESLSLQIDEINTAIQ
ncbi:ABC transporter substrate-binding protein [Budviciaceae bacterium BWR-B9]|uniref:ABC transporter substrate-binding protein n=1 Tax=Limnobaculum allomyrinae TaxID=2791986 RepID=A0ABS1IS76_9GAMM|nr:MULTISPECIES: ABC transporter substrate-binding protein [Limnobaculum]MBK5144611.1 ABC transporter substrate-binding protein [Limnobaculum allomyrinae]MBV7692158.1 ABC transporter substrate-binding protein [Limnobaculum sp. M2-1]